VTSNNDSMGGLFMAEMSSDKKIQVLLHFTNPDSTGTFVQVVGWTE
jgi:hypothetical protein